MRSASAARLAPRLAWLSGPTLVVGPERQDLRWSPRSGAGTSDAPEEVLAPGYFGAASGLLRPGDLVYVRARADGGRLAGAEPAVRMALLMVRAGAPGSVSVRLVQDFGRSDEPDAVAPTATALPAAVTAAPPSLKRSRGRPPGSRTRKNGALTTISVN